MTGSAIAIPLLGATSASAVEAASWDKVAECETGGLWNADTGNGFYGGLQMSQETWKAFGGTQYASRADLATRAQQIAIAEKVVAADGIRPWLACATIAGVKVEADPVGSPSAPAAKPATTPSPSASATKAPAPAGSASKTADPKAGPTQGSGVSKGDGQTPSQSPSTGKHRGESAAEPKPINSGDSESTGSAAPTEPAKSSDGEAPRETSGTHPSRGGDGTRTDIEGAGTGVAATPGAVGGADASPGSYTVRPGDNLWAIAEKSELPGGWPALYEANKETVGGDPDLIHPGQSLDLAASQG
ncbi:transglycosylase family protein [Streptomyces albipurpureus]|uniref:transglycosylase family protein n=1 Tax=Streptomyces albipurpureus TaxID=2897419 RepID=UPI0027E3D5AB|nr:transglycosylase family protein [Streptomyces sp. CWNU-1]